MPDLLTTAHQLADAGCSIIPVRADGTLERLLSKVLVAPSGCWIWIAGRSRQGYGQFHLNGHKMPAHRAAWLLLVGPIQGDLPLDHLCRNRACVRPLHLQPVDTRTNLLRGMTLAAANAARTTCPHGHPYDEENTLRKKGRRACRTCNRVDCARRRAAA